MTDPTLHTAGLRPSRILAGLLAAFTLLHMSSASASSANVEVVAIPETTVSEVIPAPAEPAIEEELLGAGMASYYGAELAGRRTASGERFDPSELTAAHRTLPFGSKVRVTNPANGRSVVVRINDRGPFTRNRLIDLSRSAAERIGIVARGHGHVQLALLGD